MNSKNMVINQLDIKLKRNDFQNFVRPKVGWIRILRKALGMTTKQLANKLEVHRSRVIKMEEAEQEGAITLKSLQTVAKALNCELVYAFIPKTSLANTLRNQARKIATERVQRISHSMRLENQQTNAKYEQKLIADLTESLLEKSLKHLWD